MNQRVLFVINPQSGKGRIKNNMLNIVDTFVKAKWDISVYTTQSAQDAYNIVRKVGKTFNRIVVSGGDGTLNEVICGLMSIPDENRPEIGYIPSGTVNDFASSMNISKNMIRAAGNIVGGKPFKCDIGCFNEKNFLYVAAFGAFTDISYKTPQQSKNMLGQLAYFLEGIKQIHVLPSYKMKISCNDETFDDEFLLGTVSNSNRIAGIKTERAFKAQLNDGLFEVVLIKRPKTLMELSDLGTRLLTQDMNSDLIKIFRTSQIHFESESFVQWTLDGEFGGSVKNADICVKKEAITLII